MEAPERSKEIAGTRACASFGAAVGSSAGDGVLHRLHKLVGKLSVHGHWLEEGARLVARGPAVRVAGVCVRLCEDADGVVHRRRRWVGSATQTEGVVVVVDAPVRHEVFELVGDARALEGKERGHAKLVSEGAPEEAARDVGCRALTGCLRELDVGRDSWIDAVHLLCGPDARGVGDRVAVGVRRLLGRCPA